jgi:hypothetical protein
MLRIWTIYPNFIVFVEYSINSPKLHKISLSYNGVSSLLQAKMKGYHSPSKKTIQVEEIVNRCMWLVIYFL